MKKLLLIITFSASAFICRAQTVATLADSCFAIKDYINAVDYYQQALKLEPNNIKYLRRVGFCFMNFQDQELNGTRYFNAALKIEPKDPISNYYLGIIFMDQAKRTTDKSQKSDFKAKAKFYLVAAENYGSKDAKSAISDLNGI